MPLTHFICPDGETIKCGDCLIKCRHESNRLQCPHISTLRNIVERRRPWTGKPSVTQLLNGTRQAFLEITNDYAVDPDSQVFAEHGTAVHTLIEQDIPRMEAYGFTGKPDYYDEKDKSLVDFKCAGYYKPAMILGKIPKKDPEEAFFDWKMQVNAYRVLLEKHGKPVDKMYIHVLVRDGGTFMAKKAGITRRTLWIPIDRMDDDEVIAYMTTKAAALHTALEQGFAPICNQHERWERDRKCKDFCPVNKFCANFST